MPYSVGEVIVFDTFANIPSGLTGMVVFAADTGLAYVWNATAAAYVSFLTPRVASITSSATPTINCNTTDQLNITALVVAITSVTVTGTPVDGQLLELRIKDSGGPRAIAFGASFTGTLLTTTAAGKIHLQRCKYDAAAAKWAGYLADATGY